MRLPQVVLLATTIVVAFGAWTDAQTPPLGLSRPPIHASRLLVKFRPGSTMQEMEAVHRSAGGRVIKNLPQIHWQIVEVDARRLAQTRVAYSQASVVDRVDFDKGRPLAYTPNDPYWPYMWHMVRITADSAWDRERGNPSVRVAIMDTGLQTDHPDLAANVWTNPGEVPGNGQDDDGNGYVDDVHGYDFAYSDSNPDDVYGHGTACAGLVAAVQDNLEGVTGVAPYCQLVGVKAANDSGYFYDSANVPALLYCADMGFHVVSMSFFSDQVTPAERDAIDYCWEHGVVLVAAAGNSYSVLPYYPGAYEHVVSVAALDSSDVKAWFSNFGSWVDVAAPGVSLTTTAIPSTYTTGFAGTSGATPQVAGLAALLFSAQLQATNFQVRRALEDTAIATVQAPFGEYTNYGSIDCNAALDRVLGVSSGSKPGRFLYANPVAGLVQPNRGSPGDAVQPPLLIYGVGLERANDVRVLRNGYPQALLARTRQWLKIDPLNGHGGNLLHFGNDLLELEVNGQVVGSITWERGDSLVYAATDACTIGDSYLVGGFEELYREDGNQLTCTPRSDGTIYVQLALLKVDPGRLQSMELEFVRAYAACLGGTEYVQFYNWDSWSYPYGSFENIAISSIVDEASHTITASFSGDPTRFIDDEGTMYVQIYTTGAAAGALLSADCFRVKIH